MTRRQVPIIISTLTFFWFLAIAGGIVAAEPTSSIGKKIPDLKLPDLRGRKVSLGDFQDKKAVVVFFVGTECPINNAFMPRLTEFDREYGPRGVQFLAVNSNQQDTL